MASGGGNTPMTSLPRGPAPIYTNSQGSTFNGMRNQDPYANRGGAPMYGQPPNTQSSFLGNLGQPSNPPTNSYGNQLSQGSTFNGMRNQSAYVGRGIDNSAAANMYAPRPETGGVNTVNAPRPTMPTGGIDPNYGVVSGTGASPRSYGPMDTGTFNATGLGQGGTANVNPAGGNPAARGGLLGGAPSGPTWDGLSQLDLTGASGSMGLNLQQLMGLGKTGLNISALQMGNDASAGRNGSLWVQDAQGRRMGGVDQLTGKPLPFDLANLDPNGQYSLNWSGAGPGGMRVMGRGR